MWKPRVFERDVSGSPILPSYSDYNDPDYMVYNNSPTKQAHPLHPLKNSFPTAYISPNADNPYLSPNTDFGYGISGPTVLTDQINFASPLDEVFNITN